MIIGAPPAVSARALNRRALFPAPCGRRGACAKTTASDFVTRRESFARRGAKCAPQSVWLGGEGRLMKGEEWRCQMMSLGWAAGGGEEQDEKLRRAGRAPASRAGTDADRAGGADQGPQRKAGVAEADYRYRARSLRRAAGSGAEADRARAEARP